MSENMENGDVFSETDGGEEYVTEDMEDVGEAELDGVPEADVEEEIELSDGDGTELPPSDEEEVESAAPDERDRIIAELRAQLAAEKSNADDLKSLTKETLEKMGLTVGDDLTDAMERAVAESDGVSVEEYKRRRQDSIELKRHKEAERRRAFDELTANDLSELKRSFPELLKKGSINDCFDSFGDFAEFGKLRDAGISPKRAYLAINGDKIRDRQAAAAQQRAASDGKRHITSVAPKRAADDGVSIPKETMREWRELFPDKTDREIRSLYKQSL